MTLNATSTLTLHNGNSIPVLGLGTWQLTDDTAATVSRALELGYSMIDTSGDYGTQPGIAEAIRKSDLDRQGFYIVSKVEETENAYRATHRNLEELELDYVDLMLVHRPPKSDVGEVLWEGLIQARREGLTRDIGVSNYSVERIARLAELTGEVPVVNQIEWSPFGWSEEMQSFCEEQRIVIQAYSPLTRAKRLQEKALAAIAGRYGKSPAQILIRWNLQRGTVPIPKANRPEHLIENFDVFDFVISEDDMARLSGLNEHYSSLGSLAYA